ncbi:MAG: hypothetical protein RL043_592 [Pseudomonadota bacterium]
MSLINTAIKPFKATAFQNGKFVEITEATLKGKWSVVFFYPADFTFVCPTELGDLADHYDTFKALGVEIYGVSTDTHFTHKAWHETSETINKVKYPLVGDPTGTITRNFGTPSSARCIHPLRNRALTTREGARLQSFPDSFQFYGSTAKKNLQIGNAVPPLLAFALGKQIVKALR